MSVFDRPDRRLETPAGDVEDTGETCSFDGGRLYRIAAQVEHPGTGETLTGTKVICSEEES